MALTELACKNRAKISGVAFVMGLRTTEDQSIQVAFTDGPGHLEWLTHRAEVFGAMCRSRISIGM